MARDIPINRPVRQKKWDTCRRIAARWAAYKGVRRLPQQDVLNDALSLGLMEMERQMRALEVTEDERSDLEVTVHVPLVPASGDVTAHLAWIHANPDPIPAPNIDSRQLGDLCVRAVRAALRYGSVPNG